MTQATMAAPKESFAALLDETLGSEGTIEGAVLRGVVVKIVNDFLVVDVGLKSEGLVPLREFASPSETKIPEVGDEVDVYVERYEDRNGQVVLSREKARREESWVDLEKAHMNNQNAMGSISGRVKGGYTVDLNGATAFLPNSQVDVRPIRDISPLIGVQQPFQILKIDRKRGNIVVSRRAIMEESRAEARSDFVATLAEGQVLKGVVKNITDYGAFVDLGGIDGLLHVTDISWKRVNHPSEALHVGQTIDVQVIKFNHESQRISLGMKQLEVDPWVEVAANFVVGEKYTGKVTNITEYGAFVELTSGIEGLVHVSEMSWNKKASDPQKLVTSGQEVAVIVLEVDTDKRRISLGMKQAQENPFSGFEAAHPVGTDVDAIIKSLSKTGVVLDLGDGLEGFVAAEDLDWVDGAKALKNLAEGQTLSARVLEIDTDKDRVIMGVKQTQPVPATAVASGNVKKGQIVTCTVAKVQENGIEVTIGDDSVTAFIRRADLSRDRSEQRPDRFAVGEKVDAMITALDKDSGKLTLSIKAKELDEEKRVMAEYGSTDSGASLGDILGPAMRQAVDKK
jgi:small subunit ribosomal protein S1